VTEFTTDNYSACGVCSPVPEENVGHKLLSKMGWKEGDSLGKTNTGILEPVNSSSQSL